MKRTIPLLFAFALLLSGLSVAQQRLVGANSLRYRTIGWVVKTRPVTATYHGRLTVVRLNLETFNWTRTSTTPTGAWQQRGPRYSTRTEAEARLGALRPLRPSYRVQGNPASHAFPRPELVVTRRGDNPAIVVVNGIVGFVEPVRVRRLRVPDLPERPELRLPPERIPEEIRPPRPQPDPAPIGPVEVLPGEIRPLRPGGLRRPQPIQPGVGGRRPLEVKPGVIKPRPRLPIPPRGVRPVRPVRVKPGVIKPLPPKPIDPRGKLVKPRVAGVAPIERTAVPAQRRVAGVAPLKRRGRLVGSGGF